MKDAAGPAPYRPTEELLAHWPPVSGNDVNRLGAEDRRAPRAVFWRTDGSIAHGAVQDFFFARYRDSALINETRKLYDEMRAVELHAVAGEQVRARPEEWHQQVLAAAKACGADLAGVAEYDPAWTYDDRSSPNGRWAVVLAFAHDFEAFATAPDERSYAEVMRQYARAGRTAKRLANWVRARGYAADPKTGPMSEDVLMIPAAIAAGLGELGKHGSMINRHLGANFRLSMVTTDLPLIADAPDYFGVDEFCAHCQICTKACPPAAIYPHKQWVNGEKKWYVDFDKCLPYFVENEICGICLAVCPWSQPGIAANLVTKLARRRARML